MKVIKILASVVVVSLGATLTYFIFEAAVHHAIDFVWLDVFNTDTARWLVPPLCVALSFAYFAAIEFFDKPAVKDESALGETPKPTPRNYITILGIGFLSLLAGASLGPEAILVPACSIVGLYVGTKLFPNQPQLVKLLSLAGFIALFTSFFNSFFVGFISVFLAARVAKVKVQPPMLLVSALSAVVAAVTLHFLESPAYVTTPTKLWQFQFSHIPVFILLIGAGVLVTALLAVVLRLITHVRGRRWLSPWPVQAAFASIVLSGLYLLGGPLVQFTGNESVVPMLQQAPALGTLGLLWIILIKIGAIGWSKAMGYRGGLIFPSIFVASTFVAIAGQYTQGLSFIMGLVCVMIGLIAANQKFKVLF